MAEYKIPTDEEREIRAQLENRSDTESLRMKRYLSMPDLSRTERSPLQDMVERVKALPIFKNFDVIEIPEIVPASISFDLFDFPLNHPARSASDTYYVDEKNILRTHDTVFWYYYLQLPEIKERIARGESVGALCYGKVYRKDEIDSRHMNVFHQLGGWYLAPDTEPVELSDLQNALSQVVKSIFGEGSVMRFNPDTFPYTDPSLEVELSVKGTAAEGPAKGDWLELLGGGMPKKTVLKKMGVEGYHGWAFGFGLERLAIASMALPDIRLLWSQDPRVTSQLKLGQVYKEVSKYPSVVRDISFVVSNDFAPNNYFDLIRETVGEDLIEQVELVDKYEDEQKFGKDKISYTYSIVYRSLEKTLTGAEVDEMHKKLEEVTKNQYQAQVR